ncbi:MHC class II transactivator-like [Hippopotamus amphibius kiboko]|uniref:MHC class II transactivator-like n=1 Tax=Hippopotamus amphibius kiboko TaxID=575201 RepID=UPI0025979C3B|nr:MHC class II transactivator-like [Hippopotamus amphibius kiboko]
MNHFQTILSQVRMLLSSHRPSQVQALLDNLLAEELLSREYHYALLHEPDGEALARKISLTLLEKADPDLALLGWIWSGLQAPATERDPGYKDPGVGKADLDRNQSLWLSWQEQQVLGELKL